MLNNKLLKGTVSTDFTANGRLGLMVVMADELYAEVANYEIDIVICTAQKGASTAPWPTGCVAVGKSDSVNFCIHTDEQARLG